MPMKPLLLNIYRDVIAFVMARWQDSGGFGFVPTLPASVEDTYHALRILEMVLPLSEAESGEIKQNQKLKDFLSRKEDQDAWSLKTAYQYLYVCGFCSLLPDTAWLTRFLEKHSKGMLSLLDSYYLARIRREFPVPSRTDWTSILNADLMDEWRIAEDLWMLLSLHEGSPEALHTTRDELVHWLQACQTPDGGFGGRPGTTSFIENTHWCLSALALLGSAPLLPDMARDFILRCRTRGGGFARKNGGAPFLYATWHAVAGLALLSDMEEVEQEETAMASEGLPGNS